LKNDDKGYVMQYQHEFFLKFSYFYL